MSKSRFLKIIIVQYTINIYYVYYFVNMKVLISTIDLTKFAILSINYPYCSTLYVIRDAHKV